MIKQNLLVVMALALLWPFFAVADLGFNAYERGDYVQAYKLFRKAAEQGDSSAQYNLSVLYYNGNGVQQDYKAAEKWCRKAAEQGYSSAQFRLGSLYSDGIGVKQNYKAAARWYRKAAEQGDAGAQFNLGFLYKYGRGVQQDYKAAARWYRKAAEQGGADGQYHLALLYMHGHGVQQDYKAAAKWYRKAAEQGDAGAQFRLGSLYSDGLGVARNYVQAYRWFNLAAAGGLENARTKREMVAESMTTAQIAEAQRMSASFDLGESHSGTKSDSFYAAKSKSGQATNKEFHLSGSGSGFTVGGGDYAITNHHVVDGCSKLVVYINGSSVAGSVVAFSDTDDLALIKLSKRASYQASFRGSGRARLGEDIWVVGYPLRTLLASGLNVVSGEISAIAGLGNNIKVMQVSAPVQLGSSGGPVLDSSGNVIGVVVSKLDAKRFAATIGDIPQNINFAIKGAVVKSFLDIHGIDYKTASTWAWTEKNGEEIAIKARKFTVPIECYK